MKPVAHRRSLLGPAFVVGGLALGGLCIAALHSGVIASRHGDITAAGDPATFFGTILLWAVFTMILIVVGFMLVRDAPAVDRRLDRYLADRQAAQDESRASLAAPTAARSHDA